MKAAVDHHAAQTYALTSSRTARLPAALDMRTRVHVAVAARRRGVIASAARSFATGRAPGDNFTSRPRPAVSGRALSFVARKLAPIMIEELKQKLGEEVEKLQHELNVTLPNEIRKAVELGDLRENSEYKAALERQQFVRARLGQLRERLSKLSSIDLTQIPTDRVGLGSKVVLEDQKTGAKETYNLVFGDALEFEEGQVTMASPIGRALLGKAVGEIAYLRLPTHGAPAQGRRAANDPRPAAHRATRVTASARRGELRGRRDASE